MAVVGALNAHAAKDQPIHADDANLLRQWKRWEAGEVTPGEFYQPIIARTFDTATRAMFPVPRKRDADTDLLTIAGMDTLELVSRLQRSDMDDATLNGLRVLSDTLCSEYPFTPADQLLTEGRAWLGRITQALSQRLTLQQHREVLVLGGRITLLIACVEHDTGNRPAAETTRRGALSLAGRSGDRDAPGAGCLPLALRATSAPTRTQPPQPTARAARRNVSGGARVASGAIPPAPAF